MWLQKSFTTNANLKNFTYNKQIFVVKWIRVNLVVTDPLHIKATGDEYWVHLYETEIKIFPITSLFRIWLKFYQTSAAIQDTATSVMPVISVTACLMMMMMMIHYITKPLVTLLKFYSSTIKNC